MSRAYACIPALFIGLMPNSLSANPADILITIDKVTEEKLVLYKVPSIQVQYTVKNLGEVGYCFDAALLSRDNNQYGKYKPIIRGTNREGEELTYPQFGTIAPSNAAIRVAPGESYTSFTNVEALLPGFAASNSASFLRTLQIKLYAQPCEDETVGMSGYTYLSELQNQPLQTPEFAAQSTEYQVLTEIEAPELPADSVQDAPAIDAEDNGAVESETESETQTEIEANEEDASASELTTEN